MDIEKIIKELDELNRKLKMYLKKKQEITGTLNALRNAREEILKELKVKFNIDDVKKLDEEIERIEKEIEEKKIAIENSLREIDNELNRENK